MTPRDKATVSDEAFMRLALRQARRALGKTYPNPAVGAVLVRGGRILGQGYHKRAGAPHAEIEALADCRRKGHSPAGSVLYVTLEPCNHQGRTPPCTEALIAARVRRVVIATRDSNTNVIGGGVERLRKAGIEVSVGVGEQETRNLNEAYHHFYEQRRPFITLKWAMTLDGCTSAASGDACWITGEAARRDGHRLRARHACVAVGIGTVLRDNPRLDVRMVPCPGPQPLRLIADTRLRIPETAAVIETDPTRVLIATGVRPSHPKVRRLSARGVRFLHLGKSKNGLLSLSELMETLREAEVQSVLVEGGRILAGSFVGAGLVDRVVAYIAPSLLGAGKNPLGALTGCGPEKASSARRLELTGIRAVGCDLRVECRVPGLSGVSD